MVKAHRAELRRKNPEQHVESLVHHTVVVLRIALQPVDGGVDVLSKPPRYGLLFEPSREDRHQRLGHVDAGAGERVGQQDRGALGQPAARRERIERGKDLSQEPLSEAATALGIETRALEQVLSRASRARTSGSAVRATSATSSEAMSDAARSARKFSCGTSPSSPASATWSISSRQA